MTTETAAETTIELPPLPVWGEYEAAGRQPWDWQPVRHPREVELHVVPNVEFTRRGWGDLVKEAGGSFSEARGMVTDRFVTLPYRQDTRALIDQIAIKFRCSCMIFRGASLSGGALDVVLTRKNYGMRPKPGDKRIVRLYELEDLYRDALVMAVAKGHIVAVPRDPELRALELGWRAHEAAKAERRRATDELLSLRSRMSHLEASIADLDQQIEASAEIAEKFRAWMKGQDEKRNLLDSLKG